MTFGPIGFAIRHSAHPSPSELALLSRNDLPLASSLATRWHTFTCSQCQQELAAYRQQPELARQAALDFDLPRHLDWDNLQSEMMANIHLGLEIGQIASRVEAAHAPAPERDYGLGWKGWVSIATMTACLLTGWFLSGPKARHNYYSPSHTAALVEGAVSNISADGSGVGLIQRATDSRLFLRASYPPNTRLEVGLEGSVRAATVDQDSGQITVSQVYVD